MFFAAADQRVNFNKTSIYFSNNTNNQDRTNIVNILNIQHKTTIGRYLGIHNSVFWKDPLNEMELIKCVKQKLVGWKGKTLSKAGRLMLINSNLMGMPNHVISYFKYPDRVTTKINKECRDFYWGRDSKLKPMA